MGFKGEIALPMPVGSVIRLSGTTHTYPYICSLFSLFSLFPFLLLSSSLSPARPREGFSSHGQHAATDRDFKS